MCPRVNIYTFTVYTSTTFALSPIITARCGFPPATDSLTIASTAATASISRVIIAINIIIIMLANTSQAGPVATGGAGGIPDKAWQPSFVTLETT